MTLNMFIAAPWGMWLSSDFRVSLIQGGKLFPCRDHWSPKYVTIVTTEEARLVLTYTGAAEATAVEPDFGVTGNPAARPGKRRTVDVSEWITWVLHGHADTLDQVLHRIAAEAAKVSQLSSVHHIFTGVCFGPAGDGYLVQVSNVDVRAGEDDSDSNWMSRPPMPEFQVNVRRVDTPPVAGWGALGGGAASVSDESRALVRRIKDHKPRNPKDYMNVLAKVNAQVASRNEGVSAGCHVLFLYSFPPSGQASFVNEFYPNGQSIPDNFEPRIRMNIHGIDMLSQSRSDLRLMQEALVAKQRDDDVPPREASE